MRQPGMTIWDAFASPVYILVFFLIAYCIVQWRYKGTPHAKYFYWGLGLKLVGCIAFSFIYQFYYGGGDTFRYFDNSNTLVHLFFEEPAEYFSLISQAKIEDADRMLIEGNTNVFWKPSTYMVAKISSVFGVLGFNLYLPISLLFAFGSFLGIWGLYRTCCYLYPDLYRYIAIPVFFIPSCFFWGSSLMQDSIVVGFLGALVYGIYQVLIKGRLRLFSVVILAISFWLLTQVKEYVIIAFLPAVFLWVVFSKEQQIPYRNIRLLVKPVVWVLMIVGIPIGIQLTGQISEEYSVENIFEKAEVTADWIHYVSEIQGGSTYSLGDIEYTPVGLVKVIPQAIVVTLFRPWPWEVRNPVMLLSAIEGTGLFLLTVYLMFKIGFFRFFRQIYSDPFLLACLVFSLFLAFAVGVSTFNFGSLVRYKIPCLFFYGLLLAIAYGKWHLQTIEKKQLA